MLDNKIILEEINNKFGDCLALVTGSYVQGNFQKFSDVDTIVVSPLISVSYNEKFFSEKLNRKIDCLVIPKSRISDEIDKSYHSRVGALIRMITFGQVLSDENNLLTELKKKCEFYFLKGKHYEVNDHEIRNDLIKVSNAIEDLKDSNSKFENYFTLTRIINKLSSLYLMANRLWESEGKAQAKRLKEIAPDFTEDVEKMLSTYFISDNVPEDTIRTLNKHLEKFRSMDSDYSNRKASNNRDTLFIEVHDVALSDYFLIIRNLSYAVNGKYKFYVENLYFEYDEINQKVILEFFMKHTNGRSFLSIVELYNNMSRDIFNNANSFISHDIRFLNSFGGKEMYALLTGFKKNISSSILQEIRNASFVLDTSEIFNKAFYLTLSFFKISKLNRSEFSNYLYYSWLPETYDIKALLSFEQLGFEKEKVENHYYLRFKRDRDKLKQYIDYFDENPLEETSEPGLITLMNEELLKVISNSKELESDFFAIEASIANGFSKDSKTWPVNRKILEVLFSTLGFAAIDRCYIAYILKELDDAK